MSVIHICKVSKYTSLIQSYHFVPVAIETSGAWSRSGSELIHDIGKRLSALSGDTRETGFLFQRISVAIQSGNCMCFSTSFATDSTTDEYDEMSRPPQTTDLFLYLVFSPRDFTYRRQKTISTVNT